MYCIYLQYNQPAGYRVMMHGKKLSLCPVAVQYIYLVFKFSTSPNEGLCVFSFTNYNQKMKHYFNEAMMFWTSFSVKCGLPYKWLLLLRSAQCDMNRLSIKTHSVPVLQHMLSWLYSWRVCFEKQHHRRMWSLNCFPPVMCLIWGQSGMI